VLNKSVVAAGTHDPLLSARLSGERRQMARLTAGLAKRLYVLPWLARPPIGLAELSKLVSRPADAAPASQQVQMPA
jgi:arsenite-transporting ATPase